jgi:hypothetical protein
MLGTQNFIFFSKNLDWIHYQLSITGIYNKLCEIFPQKCNYDNKLCNFFHNILPIELDFVKFYV